MGFILVNGILSYLKKVVPGSAQGSPLHSLAEKIAGGEIVSVDQSSNQQILGSGEIAHTALVHDFGSVMLYGGVGVWLLAAASFIIFGARNCTEPKIQGHSGLVPNRAGSEQGCH
jgi:hypothetical protein